jgi:hypothetical protein
MGTHPVIQKGIDYVGATKLDKVNTWSHNDKLKMTGVR